MYNVTCHNTFSEGKFSSHSACNSITSINQDRISFGTITSFSKLKSLIFKGDKSRRVWVKVIHGENVNRSGNLSYKDTS